MSRRAVALEPVRRVTDTERRSRIGVRHALAGGHRRGTVEGVAEAMTVLHATDPASIHLACWARATRVEREDVDRALDVDRTLVRQLSMRQTLFATPRDLLAAVWGSVCVRVVRSHLLRLLRDLDRGGPLGPGRGAEWLELACAAVMAQLADGDAISARELASRVPAVAGSVTVNPGTKWGGTFPLAPRVLSQLHLQARVSRAGNAAPWPRSRPLWTTTGHWLGEPPQPSAPRQGWAELVRRWLWTFGPGTVEDLRWWLGTTKSIAREALADVGAVPVQLDDGAIGWLRPDDQEPVPSPEPWVALLPVLDPSVMGWTGRGFYLGPHRHRLFDAVGNAGTTAWVNGRAVGAWAQDADGVVRLGLLEDVGAAALLALTAEAARLTEWLSGLRAFAMNPSAGVVDAAR